MTPVPELRIVSDEFWDKVKARQAALDAKRDGAKTAPVRNRRPVRALSGLLKCPECGGGISVTSHGRVGCSTHKNKGDAACTNAATVPYEVVLTSVLASVKDDLMRIEAVERLIAMAEDPVRVVELNDLLHRLLERVLVHPPENGDGDASGDGWAVELFGALPALMDAMAKDGKRDLAPAVSAGRAPSSRGGIRRGVGRDGRRCG